MAEVLRIEPLKSDGSLDSVRSFLTAPALVQ
jgi:hypothetical protein